MADDDVGPSTTADHDVQLMPGTAAAIAQAVADEVLFPSAQDVDRGTVGLGAGLRALADAGLFGLVGPTSHGGLDLRAHEARRTIAAVASGCGSTFFVWVQHHGVVRQLQSSTNQPIRDRLLSPMCAGDIIAGVAFAHVRRPGPPKILARRVGDGWELDGHAPWATSWGIADTFCVAASTDGGELVWVMVPGSAAPGITVAPLALPVFAHTGTVAFTFDRYRAPVDTIVAVDDLDRWRTDDRGRAAIGLPAVLGVADRTLRLLEHRNDADSQDAAARLRGELRSIWTLDDELVDDADPTDDWIEAASRHRAACLGLARRATTALLAASGGAGMDLSHPAQRLAREVDFYVIQAQTNDGRAATLRSV